jgi:hypothetical protein
MFSASNKYRASFKRSVCRCLLSESRINAAIDEKQDADVGEINNNGYT